MTSPGPIIDVAAGTPECCWTSVLGALPPLASLPGEGRVVVVAPHPDDEVLGCAGLLMALARLGRQIALDVVTVTDGERSHPGSDAMTPAALGARRRAEAITADRRLGVTLRRWWLGVPDGAVAAHEPSVASALEERLADGAVLCVAPWPGDGHPDHAATGRAAHAATARRSVALLAYPVWAWHWASPASGDLPLDRACRLPLGRRQVRRKAAAIAAHRTQVEGLGDGPEDGPVLPGGVLEHFTRPFEVFLR
jgi:LmbE family N-acetylglucosaminyl deacetylase